MKYNESSHSLSGKSWTFNNSSCSRVVEEDITEFTFDEDFDDDFFDSDDDDDDMSIMSDISNPRCDLSEHASSSSLMSFRSTTKKSLHSTRRKSFSGRPSHGDDSFRRSFSKRLSLGDDRRSFSRRPSQGDDSFTDTVFSLLEERAFQKLEQMQQSSAGQSSKQSESGTSDQQLANTSQPDHKSDVQAIQGNDLSHLNVSLRDCQLENSSQTDDMSKLEISRSILELAIPAAGEDNGELNDSWISTSR